MLGVMMKSHGKAVGRAAVVALAALVAGLAALTLSGKEPSMPKYAIAIHGGAGTILKENMTPELEAAYEKTLLQALEAGEDVLKQGGSSVDAVEAAIVVMEDSPLFNAGKGAVFTNDGKNELDASIMDGKTLEAGAVTIVRRVRNPVKLARAVMENSPFVLLAGDGAETFAAEQGIELVDPEYFYTERRWQQLQRARQRDENEMILEHDSDIKFGTVGAVALNAEGNLAAATSTGGLTNKRFGRVGDSPLIGAGTYASNDSCAVSGTGKGEYFIRATVARSICALVQYKGVSLEEAAEKIINGQLVEMKADGGVIAVDREGNIALVMNTPGMYRAWVKAGEQPKAAIYRD